MRAFRCPSCDNLAHFDNFACAHCGAELGFRWPERTLVGLGLPDAGAGAGDQGVRCRNHEIAACNWLVAGPGELCASCSLTRRRPADEDAEGMADFAPAEAAKRRLLFELAELGLPIRDGQRQPPGLIFDLLHEVTTGHDRGLITLDLHEVDDAHREAIRDQLGEPYRTVLGHFRHEVGHYYQSILLGEDKALWARARALFGDERTDYQAAIERHYEQGPPPDWQDDYVSAYATMHPWEDWAETFAHLLHIRDTMQTAVAYGIAASDLGRPIRELLADWLPLTIALNAINASMGKPDLYPFVLSAPVVGKLSFVDELVTGTEK